MREFDDFEKATICKLKKSKERGDTHNFLSLLADIFADRGIEIKKSSREAWIYFDPNKFAYYDNSINTWIPKSELQPEVERTIEIIIRMIFLLKYLERNGLVFLYDFSRTDNDVESFSRVETLPHMNQQMISDIKVVDLIINFFHKEVVVSQSIITLVNNKFLTKEEIQHKETIEYANKSLLTGDKSITVANRAINVSIALGVVSVLISLYSIILNIQQTDQLEKSIRNLDATKSSQEKLADSVAHKLNKK